METRRFVIGDIHGCYNTLRRLLFDVCGIQKNDYVYFLGDYIDRGRSSKEVLDLILDLKDTGYRIRALTGNHEAMLEEAKKGSLYERHWIANGGDKTLESFAIQSVSEINQKYIQFFSSLENYILLDDYLLTHAGFNFYAKKPFQDTMGLIWERTKVVYSEKIGGRKLISGHTPQPLSEIIRSLKTNRIWLDGGCVYKGIYPNYGHLCALELNSLELLYLENCEVTE